MSRKLLTATAALALGISIAALAALPLSAAPIKKPTQKPIMLHEVFTSADPGSPLVPISKFDVCIADPHHIKIIMASQQTEGKPEHEQYVDDGTLERQYNAEHNTYTIIKSNTDGTSQSSLRAEAKIDTILRGTPPVSEGATRTTSTDTLNGRICSLTTDTAGEMQLKQGPVHFVYKHWVDQKTHLLLRYSEYVVRNGKITEFTRQLFMDYVVGKPIPAMKLAWNIPSNAKSDAEPTLLPAGTVAPDFSVVSPNGKTVHLSDFKGKTVILDFWATWCVPCQMAMPHLDTVYKGVKDQGVQVLAICVWDRKASYDKWVVAKKDTYTFPTYFDTAATAATSIASRLYDVSTIPTQYIIDKDGKIVAAHLGYEDGDHSLEDGLTKMGITVSKTATN